MEHIQLPFDTFEKEFLDLVRKHQVVVLAAETGAGKSTKAPLALLNAGFGGNKMIGVTEPRRPAATLLAKWVAELHGTELGNVIGYQIGQDCKLGRSTMLKYMTEGILLAELHGDPELHRYSVIVLDEVHERGVNQDLLMALVKDVLPKRPDLKVVVMSATIDTDKFAEYFGGAPILEIPGRVYPVDVRYANVTPENGHVFEMCIEKIVEILNGNEGGDILAFLPDQDSITKVVKGLEDELESRMRSLRILPLYGSQAPDDQAQVFVRDQRRRIIVATNIAETSLTIDGVRHVVDSGLIKAMCYVDASMSALQVVEHSRAGCDQRKGRAGRTQAGVCHRLYTQENFFQRDGFTKPEILRMALDQVLLRLRCLNFSMEEVLALDLMDKPKEDQWKDAEARLKLLGAIGADGSVTQDGVRMNRFQVEPMIGRMILEGVRRGCVEEIITIAACLTATNNIFVLPKGKEQEAKVAHVAFHNLTSDPLTYLKVWKAWDKTDGDRHWARDHYLSSKALAQVDRIRGGFLDLLEREGIEITSLANDIELKKAIAAGLIVNLAQKGGRFNYQWKDKVTFIFPGSALMGTTPPPFVVCAKVVESSKAYMRGVHTIDPKWIAEIVPLDACKNEITVERSYLSDQIEFVSRRSFNGIEIERENLEMISETTMSLVTSLIIDELVREYGFVLRVAPTLQIIWNKCVSTHIGYSYGEEREQLLRPLKKQFTQVIMSRLSGVTTISKALSTLSKLGASDFLTGEAFASFQRENIRAIAVAEETQARRGRELLERARIERENIARCEEELVPLRERVQELDARVKQLGVVLSWSDHNLQRIAQLIRPSSYETIDDLRKKVDDYQRVVERLERENAPKFDATRTIYARVLELMPVCPLCGNVWSQKNDCENIHDLNRLIAIGNKGFTTLGTFKTNRDEQVAELLVRGNRIELRFSVARDRPWHGNVFKTISCESKVVILPESLVGERELIELWLAELAEAKKALEAELVRVERLRQGVANGDIVCLSFHDRGDGFMVADFERKQLLAPHDDLTHYPKEDERWWCRIVRTGSVVNLFLLDRAGVYATRADIDKIITDGLSMFPDLPRSLFN